MDGPRLGVRLRIVHRNSDFQFPKVGPMISLRHLGRIRQRRAADIQPKTIFENRWSEPPARPRPSGRWNIRKTTAADPRVADAHPQKLAGKRHRVHQNRDQTRKLEELDGSQRLAMAVGIVRVALG